MPGRPPHPRPHNLIIVCGLRAAINAPHTFTAAGFTTSFLDLMRHILPYFRFSISTFLIICHSGNSWTMLCPTITSLQPLAWLLTTSHSWTHRWIGQMVTYSEEGCIPAEFKLLCSSLCQFVNWFDSLSKTTQAIQRRINHPGPICAQSHSIGWTLQKKLLHPW